MNQTSARRYVLLSIFGLLALEAYRGKLETSQVGLAKRLWGVGVLGIALSLLADVAPSVAGPFAVLVLVGAFTNPGDKAFVKLAGGGETVLTNVKGQVHPPTHPGANP